MSISSLLRILWRHPRVVGTFALLSLLGLAGVLVASPPTYRASAAVVLLNPPAVPTATAARPDIPPQYQNPYVRFGDLSVVVDILVRITASQEVVNSLKSEGLKGTFTIAANRDFYRGPIVDVASESTSKTASINDTKLVIKEIQDQLVALQTQQGTDPNYFIRAELVVGADRATTVFSGTLRLLIAAGGLGGILTIGSGLAADAIERRRLRRSADAADDETSDEALDGRRQRRREAQRREPVKAQRVHAIQEPARPSPDRLGQQAQVRGREEVQQIDAEHELARTSRGLHGRRLREEKDRERDEALRIQAKIRLETLLGDGVDVADGGKVAEPEEVQTSDAGETPSREETDETSLAETTAAPTKRARNSPARRATDKTSAGGTTAAPTKRARNSPARRTTDKVQPETTSPETTSPETAAPEPITPKRRATDKLLPDGSTPPPITPDRNTPKRRSTDKVSPNETMGPDETPLEPTSSDEPAVVDAIDDAIDDDNGSQPSPSSEDLMDSTVTGRLPDRYVAPGDRQLDADPQLNKTNGSASTRKGKRRRRPPGPRVPNDVEQPR